MRRGFEGVGRNRFIAPLSAHHLLVVADSVQDLRSRPKKLGGLQVVAQ